ncbi:MAG: hypothetical protein IT393_07645 [Nitrospirae bacterium]|nr:hypothetical protein [Nitrospirota bacterium]
MIIGVEADFEIRDMHAGPTDRRTWTVVDLMYQPSDRREFSAGYGIEDINDASNVVWLKVEQQF